MGTSVTRLTGWLPRRRGFDGAFPLDGASGQQEWDGIVPFDEMPTAFNPASGRIVSANTNIFPASFPYGLSGQFASHYRQTQIDAMLMARSGWRPEEMLVVQKDVYSALFDFLARQALAATASKKRGPARQGADLLRNWNGQMEKGTPQPVVAQLLFQQVRRRFGQLANREKGAEYRTEISAAVVERLLRERPAGWFADWDSMLVDALGDAYEEAQRMYGRSDAKWDYGVMNTVHLRIR